MLFRQHLALLSTLIKEDDDALAWLLRHGPICLKSFAQFIAQHRLQLFVFSQLQGSPVRRLLPQQWLDQLKASYLRRWAAQERLIRELMQVSRRLTTAGHEFILLKGPYVAERFFGGTNRREFFDLDVLIRREELAAVQRCLCDNGYLQNSSILFGRSLTAYFTHALNFVNGSVTIDLHWKFSAQFRHRLDYEQVWRQKRSFTLRGQNFLVLSDEYEVVFQLISIFKELEMGIARLRAFVDLYFVLEKIDQYLDWEAFLQSRERERIRGASLTVLALLLQFFDCGDRFKELAAIIGRERGHLNAVPVKDQDSLMERVPGRAWNRIWASRAYDCPRVTLLLWWLASWPFRLAVYEPAKYHRLKNYLHPTRNRALRWSA